MTTRRRTATVFVNRTFTNATPARNTTLIHVHARTVPKKKIAAVLTKAGTLTETADAKLFVRTGNTGEMAVVIYKQGVAIQVATALVGTVALLTLAYRDAILMISAVTAKVVFQDYVKQLAQILHARTPNTRHALLTVKIIFANAHHLLVLRDIIAKDGQ